MGARFDDLAALEGAVWQELARAPRDAGHEWRHATLATRAGEAADARTVVLREVDPVRRVILFYTDARSPKVAQIEACPEAVLLLWSRSLSWQLRARVRLEVQADGLAVTSRWAILKGTPAAQDYLSPLAPGSEIDAPVIQRASRAHFAVVTAEVQALDWLELSAEGHRRAAFDAAGRRWLAP